MISAPVLRLYCASYSPVISRIKAYSCAPLEVVENLSELDDDDEIYETIEDIWPDYPSKEDFLWNEEEY